MVDVIISEKTIFTSWSSEHRILRFYVNPRFGTPVSFGGPGSLAYRMYRDDEFEGSIKWFEEYELVEGGKTVPGLSDHQLFEALHKYGVEFQFEGDAVAFKLACL